MSRWPYNTSTWRRLRAAKLAVQPVCEVCERRGHTVPARAVDHVKAVAAGGDPFPALSGLMALCDACHNSKTARTDMPGRRQKLGSVWKGCAVDGGSVDPNDEWNSQPGADSGRQTAAEGTPPQSKTELVANDSQQESERWV